MTSSYQNLMFYCDNLSGTSKVNIVAGEASKVKIVHSLLLHNYDTLNRNVSVFLNNGVSDVEMYTLRASASLQSADTLNIADFLGGLPIPNGYTLKAQQDTDNTISVIASGREQSGTPTRYSHLPFFVNDLSGTSQVSVVSGEAGKIKYVGALLIHNKDVVQRDGLLEVYNGSSDITMFELSLESADTLNLIDLKGPGMPIAENFSIKVTQDTDNTYTVFAFGSEETIS